MTPQTFNDFCEANEGIVGKHPGFGRQLSMVEADSASRSEESSGGAAWENGARRGSQGGGHASIHIWRRGRTWRESTTRMPHKKVTFIGVLYQHRAAGDEASTTLCAYDAAKTRRDDMSCLILWSIVGTAAMKRLDLTRNFTVIQNSNYIPIETSKYCCNLRLGEIWERWGKAYDDSALSLSWKAPRGSNKRERVEMSQCSGCVPSNGRDKIYSSALPNHAPSDAFNCEKKHTKDVTKLEFIQSSLDVTPSVFFVSRFCYLSDYEAAFKG